MPGMAVMKTCCLLGKVSVIISDYGQRNRGSLDSKSPQFQQNSCGAHRCRQRPVSPKAVEPRSLADYVGRLDTTVPKFASFVVAWELTPVISAACCGPLKDKDLS